jgi:hypothetical protein
MLGISGMATELVASRVALSSIELVNISILKLCIFGNSDIYVKSM